MSPHWKVYGLSGGGTQLCLFSGPHSQEVNPDARKLFGHMQWVISSHWFEWAAVFVYLA